MVSLSLDAWTSSNNITFLAIVVHYTDKDGQLRMYMHPRDRNTWLTSLLFRRDSCGVHGAHRRAQRREHGGDRVEDAVKTRPCWQGISFLHSLYLFRLIDR